MTDTGAESSARQESSTLIQLEAVTKTYSTGAVDFTALDRADLMIGAGEFVGIVGPSGSGKSTLLNMVAGIDRPTAGRVLVGDVEVSALSEDEAARWRGRTLGVVFQFFQLLPMLTLADNVMLPMDFCGVHRRADRPRIARDLLERVGLADQADKLPSETSGGQQQRAAIARALANDAPIVLGDEPTGNLDSETAASMMALFDDLVASGSTVMMVTHDRDIAGRIPRIVEVHDGTISDRVSSPPSNDGTTGDRVSAPPSNDGIIGDQVGSRPTHDDTGSDPVGSPR